MKLASDPNFPEEPFLPITGRDGAAVESLVLIIALRDEILLSKEDQI
jgi:hypothetical protein